MVISLLWALPDRFERRKGKMVDSAEDFADWMYKYPR